MIGLVISSTAVPWSALVRWWGSVEEWMNIVLLTDVSVYRWDLINQLIKKESGKVGLLAISQSSEHEKATM